MTLDEWLATYTYEDKECLCVADGWNAGAKAMLDFLLDRGFVPRWSEKVAIEQAKYITNS